MSEAEYEAMGDPEKELMDKAWSYFCGYGLVNMVSLDEFGAGPRLHYKIWNKREALPADVRRFQQMTAKGMILDRYNPAHAVTVAVNMACLDEDDTGLTMLPREALHLNYVDYQDETAPLAIVVDGHHRHALLCTMLQEKIKAFLRLKQILDKGKEKPEDLRELERQQKIIQRDLEQKGQWLARVYDLCEQKKKNPTKP